MKLYNTLSRSIEEFTPLKPPQVTLYTCGPTVYDFTHIGHLRTFTNNDVLKRTLIFLGYRVKHVMNITDVGHLTGDNEGDADTGEDKMEKGARKYGKSVWDVAKMYTDQFLESTAKLNITPPDILAKATEHIPSMIAMIKILETKGFTYETNEAVYFDIAKFPDYGKLSGQKLQDKIKGSREEVYVDLEKKHPADFALWFKRVGRFANHTMYWESPWGDGFPGWHIECSAMAREYLGDTIDIHTGGIEHIPVHHENEIAQSECATGHQFVRYFVHNNMLLVEGQKMSKSLGNIFTIEDVIKKGIDPMALRLLYLQTHYRQEMNFTWTSVAAAQEAYSKLKDFILTLKNQTQRKTLSEEKLGQLDTYRNRFRDALGQDVMAPQAVAILWELIKSNVPSEDKIDLLYEFDEVLGLDLRGLTQEKIPKGVTLLAEDRETARKNKDFAKSDELRQKIIDAGYLIEDSPTGYRLRKK